MGQMRQKAASGFFWRVWRRPLGLSSRPRTEEELLLLLHDPSLSETDRQAVEEQLFLLVRERIGNAVDGFCGALAGMEYTGKEAEYSMAPVHRDNVRHAWDGLG